jgi:hypothetical protein
MLCFGLVYDPAQCSPLQQDHDGKHGGDNRESGTSDHRNRHSACHPLRFVADRVAAEPSNMLSYTVFSSISQACTNSPRDSP